MLKLDPSGPLLSSLIDLNNLALSRFSPFCDDTSTSPDTACAKIEACVYGTALAAKRLGARHDERG